MFQWHFLWALVASIPWWILQVLVAWDISSGMVLIGSIMPAPSSRNRWTSNVSWLLTSLLCLFLEVIGQARSLLVFVVQSLFWWSCKLVLCFFVTQKSMTFLIGWVSLKPQKDYPLLSSLYYQYMPSLVGWFLSYCKFFFLKFGIAQAQFLRYNTLMLWAEAFASL